MAFPTPWTRQIWKQVEFHSEEFPFIVPKELDALGDEVMFGESEGSPSYLEETILSIPSGAPNYLDGPSVRAVGSYASIPGLTLIVHYC